MMNIVRSRLANVARGSFSTATSRSVASRNLIGAYSREADLLSATSPMNSMTPTTRYWSSMILKEISRSSEKIMANQVRGFSNFAKLEEREVSRVVSSRSKSINNPILWHINDGIEEIIKDYVHHENLMDRTCEELEGFDNQTMEEMKRRANDDEYIVAK